MRCKQTHIHSVRKCQCVFFLLILCKKRKQRRLAVKHSFRLPAFPDIILCHGRLLVHFFHIGDKQGFHFVFLLLIKHPECRIGSFFDLGHIFKIIFKISANGLFHIFL